MAPEGCVHVRRGLSAVLMGSGWLWAYSVHPAQLGWEPSEGCREAGCYLSLAVGLRRVVLKAE
jgi:hypothetical protein